MTPWSPRTRVLASQAVRTLFDAQPTGTVDDAATPPAAGDPPGVRPDADSPPDETSAGHSVAEAAVVPAPAGEVHPSPDAPKFPAGDGNPTDPAPGQRPGVPAPQPAPASPATPSPPGNPGPAGAGQSPVAPPGGLALPHLDARTIAALAPVAMTGLMLAPTLLSALAGGGSRQGTAAPVSAAPTAKDTAAVLGGLGNTYGTGAGDSPAATPPAKPVGSSSQNGSASTATGSGATTAAAAAARLYQSTVAVSFHNLDVQLANYMARLAGSHGLDRAKLYQLLHDMDAALAAVGPAVYTADGRQRVHQILTLALQKGQYLVTGTAASAADTAAAIDQLTAQYLYNINGRNYTPTMPTMSGVAGTAINVALSQLGKPYVYGATGPNSFDCSGLTQYAARAAGVQIPRTSQEQYHGLPAVSPANIRPGDLIFPSTSFSQGVPLHVMMYIGNGQCVEAPHTGAVVRICAVPGNFSAARWTQG